MENGEAGGWKGEAACERGEAYGLSVAGWPYGLPARTPSGRRWGEPSWISMGTRGPVLTLTRRMEAGSGRESGAMDGEGPWLWVTVGTWPGYESRLEPAGCGSESECDENQASASPCVLEAAAESDARAGTGGAKYSPRGLYGFIVSSGGEAEEEVGASLVGSGSGL
jgi:hypothetical protein